MKSSRHIITVLKEKGWQEMSITGSHHKFKHISKPGRVVVPHPKKDLPVGTLRSIAKMAGLKLSDF